MSADKLQVGLSGLGRMGKRHALIWLHQVPRACLVAVSSPDTQERQWAIETLGPHGVAVFERFDDMLQLQGLQAIRVASATSAHAEQITAAVKAGKHVMCEKPLSTTIEVSQSVVDFAAARPDLKVMCGFSRRFDASYRDAHKKVRDGVIGRPTVMRCQTCDMLDPSGFFVAYAQFSGGIFVDCSIHDVDLALWFFGEDSKVKSVYATGVVALNQDLHKFNDRDNAVGVVEFHNGQVLSLYTSRMGAGQEDSTEVMGTAGKLTINMVPSSSHVRVYEVGNVRQEMPHNYWERFQNAFSTEAIEFAECVLDDKPVPIPLTSAVTAVRIGAALQESMITGQQIMFDEEGNRIARARL